MHRGLLLVILFICCGVQAQVKPSSTSFSFGDLYRGSNTYTDITFTNTSDKVQYLLTIDKPTDVYYIFSGKRLEPDSSITIRFQVNDKKKGRFSYSVDVYFSNPREPFTIQLSGNVKETNTDNSMTACPDFNSQPPDKMTEFYMVVRVIDSLTREPIPNAKVYIVENGELIGSSVTNFKGIVKKKMNLGYYYITAQRDPYNSNYYEGYMNFKRNYVEIELSHYPNEEPILEEPVVEEPVIEEPVVVEPVVEEPIIEEPVVVEPVVEEPVVDTIEIVINEDPVVEEPVVEEPAIVEPAIEPAVEPVVEPVVNEPPIADPVEPVALVEVPDTVFTPGYFKFNNITFILDVSSSMNGMGKLELLKLSMIELAKILRSDDIVSMVKFSSVVETIMQGSSGDEKDEIITTVKGLRTSSKTAGGDAIKEAYKLNNKNYIKGGNNIVIMITDGVFNSGDKNYLETIKSNYAKKGIIFSVVGIKTSDYITSHMKNIVKHGGGDFIRILSVDDALHKLIDEIRRTSFRF